VSAYRAGCCWAAGWRGRKRWRAAYVRQSGRCALCGVPVPVELMTRDHIVPLSRGGGTDWDNIQLTCEQCNARKADSPPNTEADGLRASSNTLRRDARDSGGDT